MKPQAVILAAGYSSRAGTFKMQLDFGGKPILLRSVELFQKFCSTVFVVAGFQEERIQSLVEGYDFVTVVQNPDFAQGMFSSVRAGVARVTADRFFFTPGDCPLISHEVCAKLLESKKEAAIPTYGGKRGHPVLLNGACVKEILAEPADSNLKKYLSGKDCVFVEVGQEGILMDVDTMEDYRSARQYAEKLEKEGADPCGLKL